MTILDQQSQAFEATERESPGPSAARPAPPARAWAAALLGLVCLLACLAAFYATRYSIGLSPDSRGYLMAARAVLEGRGVLVIDTNGDYAPLTQLAPLYSVMLAGARLVLPSIESAARWLNLALFAANIVLIWLVVRDAARHAGAGESSAFGAALMAALVASLAPEMLQAHCMVWSESAFLLFTLLFIWLLGRAVQPGAGWGLLALAAIAASLAGITRYSGAALVMAGLAALLIDPNRRFTVRFGRAVGFAVIGSAAPIAWFARNLGLTGNLANRKVAYHPPDIEDLRYLLDTIGHWIVPHGVKLSTTLAAGLTIAGIIAGLWLSWPRGTRDDGRKRAPHAGTIAGLLIVMYAIFILASKTLVDAHTRFDQRILLPVLVCGVLYLLPRMANYLEHAHLPRGLIVAATALLLAGQGTRAAIWVYQAPDRWLGYGSQQWARSDLLDFVRDLPPHALIYSNADDLIYLRLGRFAKPTPKVVDPVEAFRSGRYRRRLEAMRQDMLRQSTSSYVVCFNTIVRDYQVTTNRIRNTLDLRTEFMGRDGVVFVPTKKTRENAPPPASRPAGGSEAAGDR